MDIERSYYLSVRRQLADIAGVKARTWGFAPAEIAGLAIATSSIVLALVAIAVN